MTLSIQSHRRTAPIAIRVTAAGCVALLLALLMVSLPACGRQASAAGSRHAAVLERAFPDPRAQALAIAAERGDAAEVRRLMKVEGVNPDTIFAGGIDAGMPLLAWPIYARNPDGLRLMLENGADPNVKQAYETPDRGTRFHANTMVWAAEQEDPAYLHALLDHGGDPDTRNANRETLLFHAFIKQNQWRNIRLLVERGADVNAQASTGTIVGTYASRGGFEMVHWLLEHGADPSLDYPFGKPTRTPDSFTIQAVFWHPGNPDDPTWQRRCQQWLLAHGHARPPMPKHYRTMRENLGFPHEEAGIPLL